MLRWPSQPRLGAVVRKTTDKQNADGGILIVEDEWLIATDIEHVLVEAGFTVVGPASSVDEARHLMKTHSVAAALLDINLTEGDSFGLAARLSKLGIPYAFLTGYNTADLPGDLAYQAVLSKPVLEADLRDTASRLIASED